MATASLSNEFFKYHRNCRLLRRILKKTLETVNEIKSNGKFYEDQLQSVEFTQEELKNINHLIDCPPHVIILGQNACAKARLVNELFSQSLLPQLANHRDSNWRTVRILFGINNEISVSLPDSYVLVGGQTEFGESGWSTVPLSELELENGTMASLIEQNAVLEVRLHHPLLKEDMQVIVSPTDLTSGLEEFLAKHTANVLPILIYVICEDALSSKDLDELTRLQAFLPERPVLFIHLPSHQSCELTESEQHAQHEIQDQLFHVNNHYSSDVRTNCENEANTSLVIFRQLCDAGFVSMLPNQMRTKYRYRTDVKELQSEFIESCENIGSVVQYIHHLLRSHIIAVASILNNGHTRCLRMFISSAFDMTRDMLITPKRLEYVRGKENELYNSLLNTASHKQDEIKEMIVETITNMHDDLLEKAANHVFQGVQLPPSGVFASAKDFKIASGEIQDLILNALNSAIAQRLTDSVEYLRESFVGTLRRCIESLEEICKDDSDSNLHASRALSQILNAAYQIEITAKTSSSFMRLLWEKMKQLIQSMPWKTPPRIDAEWKKRVATDMIASLSESRLAKSICSQFRDKLGHSHELFAASLHHLESLHNGRLEKTELQRIKVRKELTPRIARYALESTSLRDALLHGMPRLGKEIGRGQYGVVYSCDSWAGRSPCALKSVVPPDDKHWNDLAMEFYYTRSVPEHSRIVAIRGSVIDRSYGGGSAAVLLIMDRLQQDLHTAIKNGIEWLVRLQISIDVVQGIRYLHSQGLIHRDIKLKNVLMDKTNRAKITDLGFCKPEAMMSGSIVGTPIHMAPELFTGKYDSTVDVYAFGILFWYICAGHVRLPYIYEQCLNKDQLWKAVKRGRRPERLTQFDDNCWNLMEECWSGEPALRPLLGDVENRLWTIMDYYKDKSPPDEQRIVSDGLDIPSSPASPYINLEFTPP